MDCVETIARSIDEIVIKPCYIPVINHRIICYELKRDSFEITIFFLSMGILPFPLRPHSYDAGSTPIQGKWNQVRKIRVSFQWIFGYIAK